MSKESNTALYQLAMAIRESTLRRQRIKEATPQAVAVIMATLTKGLSFQQNRQVAKFVAWLYNSSTFKFDISELRDLDNEILDACLDFMKYCFATNEDVHHTLPGGRRKLMDFLVTYQVCTKRFADDACAHDN